MAADDIKRTRAERVILWQRCEAKAAAPLREAGSALDERGDDDGADADTDTALHTGRFTELAIARYRASGAEVLAGIGSTVVASVDTIELADAVELARTLADEAARATDALKIDIGIAIGEVEETIEPGKAPTYRGGVIDRAQALANGAHEGEVVLDEPAQLVAAEHYLFGREVSVGDVRGRALDPHNARKDACRRALADLHDLPLAPSALPLFSSLVELVKGSGQTRVVLHCGSPTAPLALLDRVAEEAPPPLRLRISRKAGGLQPLGGLELALRRAWPSDAAREAASLPPALRAIVKALLRGQGVARAEMVEALAELLRVQRRSGGRAWITLDQLHEIDPATLGVVAETLLAPDLEYVLFMTQPLEASVPQAFVPKGELHTLTLPPLDAKDGRVLAAAVLGLEENAEVVQRVAALGGDSPLGVLEAARTLVSAGDLVLRGAHGFGFGWRTEPRASAGEVPVDALITERASGLPPDAYRVLETLCLAPPGATRELIERIADRDGVNIAQLDAGLKQLTAEKLVASGLSLGSADAVIRGAVRNSMPPARAAELHRFVAEELRAKQKAPGFGSAQIAYHLAEGGQEADAARLLIDAGSAAVNAGFQRVALRLLATAVELDGSPETRKRASEVASTASVPSAAISSTVHEAVKPKSNSAPPAAAPDMAGDAMVAARKAIQEHDYDGAERWLDTAVAAGFGRSAAQRMLAITQLARGDAADATLTLSRATVSDAPPAVQARDALGWALVHLESGQAARGVRDALGALAASRRLHDERGERAALLVLSKCYETLEREADAERIRNAADPRAK